ncbi:DUF7284 family protein [Halorientalis pallida]|uniref:DUF7284 family protein n=1 Tax=Halorientalis pallida TaxID=2479928 RepID=UPI003C6EF7E1
MRRSDRGISTVVDVSMALLLISASVVMLAVYINDEETARDHEAARADQTAELLSSTTVNVTYSLDSLSGPEWRQAKNDVLQTRTDFSSGDYSRTTHGTSAALLAEAAVSKATIDGQRFTREGADFVDATSGNVRVVLGNTGVDAYVRAVWRPYEKSDIEGTVSVGNRPPGDEDVSSSTLVVPSGMPPIEDERVREVYLNAGYDGLATVIANRVVEGYFPPVSTQHALESNGINRALAVYRYRRAETVLGFNGYRTTDVPLLTSSVISSSGANARAANSRITASLARNIEANLRDEYGDDVTADELANDVSTGDVRIVVQTWT